MYNITFKVDTPGQESIVSLRTQVLLMQQQYQTAGAEIKKSVSAIDAATREANQAAMEGDQKRAVSRMAAASAERAALDSLIRKERELKLALDEVSGSSQKSISQMAATSGALRTLEGNLPIRAVENFLTKTLGLGPAFAAAFPLVGAVAAAEMIGRITEKIVDLYKSVRDAKERIAGEFGEINHAIAASNDELKVSNDRLENEIAKLEHKPENALKLALDEATVASERLASSLGKDLEALENLLKKNNVGGWKAFFTHELSTTDIGKEIGGETGFGGFRGKLADITDEGNAKIRVATDLKAKDAAQTELDTRLTKAYAVELAKLNRMLDDTKRDAAASGGMGPNDTARVELLKGSIRNLGEEREGIGLRGEQSDLEGKRAAVKAAADAGREARELQKRQAEELIRLQYELASASGKELLGVDAINARRDATIAKLKSEKLATGDILEVVNQIAAVETHINFTKALDKGQKAAYESASRSVASEGHAETQADRFGSREFLDGLRRDIKETEEFLSFAGKIQKRSEQSDVDGVRKSLEVAVRGNANAAKSGSIVPGAAAVNDYQARLEAAGKIFDIETHTLDIRKLDSGLEDVIAGRRKTLTDQEFKDAERLADARKQWADEVYQAESQYEETLNAERAKQLHEFQSEVGKVFDALISRQPNALANLLKSEVTGIGKTIIENLAKEAWPTIKKGIPHAQAGTELGRVFEKTPFGPDPLKGSASALDVSAGKLVRLGRCVDEVRSQRGRWVWITRGCERYPG